MATYTIYLERLEVVRRAAQVRHVVHSAMEPLVRRAGHELNLVAVPVRAVEDVDASRIDVSLEFVLNRDVANPRDRVLAEQSGHVLVGSILHMRVEAPPRMTCRRAPPSGSPLDARGLECGVEHSGVVERLFQTQDAAFARTVGNIAGTSSGTPSRASTMSATVRTSCSRERAFLASSRLMPGRVRRCGVSGPPRATSTGGSATHWSTRSGLARCRESRRPPGRTPSPRRVAAPAPLRVLRLSNRSRGALGAPRRQVASPRTSTLGDRAREVPLPSVSGVDEDVAVRRGRRGCTAATELPWWSCAGGLRGCRRASRAGHDVQLSVV